MLFQTAAERLDYPLLEQLLLVAVFFTWFICVYILPCNWLISVFNFINTPSFLKFWNIFFPCCRSLSNLDSFGAGLHASCCNCKLLSKRLELKQALGIFRTICQRGLGERCFCCYFITHCYTVFCVNVNRVNPFTCCCDISAVPLSKWTSPFVSVEILSNKIAIYSNKPILRVIRSKSSLKQILKCSIISMLMIV